MWYFYGYRRGDFSFLGRYSISRLELILLFKLFLLSDRFAFHLWLKYLRPLTSRYFGLIP